MKVTPQMLAQALNAPQPKEEQDNDRVPYLAGMNKKGTEIFFSKDFPHQLLLPNGRVIDPKPFVARHEEVETSLMHHIGYEQAHHIATQAEHAMVAQAGIDPRMYEMALRPFINKAHIDKAGKEPKALNRKPYRSA